MKLLSIPSRLRNLYLGINEFLCNFKEYQLNQRQFIEFTELQMEAQYIHLNTFSKYKDVNKEKEVAIIGSGPSLDKWKAPENCVQIGVNGAFMASNVNLDYWFIQDYNNKMLTQFDALSNKSCRIFFGIHYMLPSVWPIPFVESERMGAERYFFYDCPSRMFPFDFTVDIAARPFITYGSTIFVALQFALYTHPKRIYVVGCDCSGGHFSSHANKLHDIDVCYMDVIIEGWKKFARFSAALYPDIEIVSVNPVGLKSLFKDEYTE